jgi:hypothetical protein
MLYSKLITVKTSLKTFCQGNPRNSTKEAANNSISFFPAKIVLLFSSIGWIIL